MTYHPLMPNIKDIHLKHNHILESSDTTRSIFNNPPLIATRRTPNLGNLLIKTKPKSTPSKPLGTFPCNKPRCLTCNHIQTGTHIKSHSTGHSFPIRHHITCTTKNIIYVITCKICNIQYTGHTTNTLRTRFNNHKATVRNHHINTPVGKHFNLPLHDGINSMVIQGAELVDTNEILFKESIWMWRIKSHQATGGLNIDEPFFKNLTIFN